MTSSSYDYAANCPSGCSELCANSSTSIYPKDATAGALLETS